MAFGNPCWTVSKRVLVITASSERFIVYIGVNRISKRLPHPKHWGSKPWVANCKICCLQEGSTVVMTAINANNVKVESWAGWVFCFLGLCVLMMFYGSWICIYRTYTVYIDIFVTFWQFLFFWCSIHIVCIYLSLSLSIYIYLFNVYNICIYLLVITGNHSNFIVG